MCVNAHKGARYFNEEGYDIKSTYIVSIIQEPKESVTESSNYDEEMILEGLGMDSSRISQSLVPSTF